MPVFGIDDAEFNDLPESLQKALRAAEEQGNSATALKVEIEELKKNQKTKEEPPPPTPSQWNPPVSTMDELTYNNRMDVILMGMKQNNNPKLATCVRMFEDEILENLAKSHPINRADKNYVTNIIDMVAGRHLAEITQDIRANGGKFNSLFTEGGSGNLPPTPVKKTGAESLSPEEVSLANRLNIPLDVFAAEKEAMNG